MQMPIRIWIRRPDADPDSNSDPSFQIKAQTLEKVLKYSIHFGLDADQDAVPDPDFYHCTVK